MAAPFVDTAKITVRSGSGGNGVVSFHREKYVAAGGPDGGDGGRGGNVVVTVDDHMSTLMDFRYKRKYVAGNGAPGGGNRRTGRDGEDLLLSLIHISSSPCPIWAPPPRRARRTAPSWPPVSSRITWSTATSATR